MTRKNYGRIGAPLGTRRDLASSAGQSTRRNVVAETVRLTTDALSSAMQTIETLRRSPVFTEEFARSVESGPVIVSEQEKFTALKTIYALRNVLLKLVPESSLVSGIHVNLDMLSERYSVFKDPPLSNNDIYEAVRAVEGVALPMTETPPNPTPSPLLIDQLPPDSSDFDLLMPFGEPRIHETELPDMPMKRPSSDELDEINPKRSCDSLKRSNSGTSSEASELSFD